MTFSACTLYVTAASGNSFKPMLVLRQLGADAPACDIRPVDVVGGETRRPDFLALNPRGQVPYLITADGRGLAESNAIAWYLAERSPLMPADPYSRAQALQWMIFEQTALEPNISPARFYTHIVPNRRAQAEADLPGWLAQGHHGLGLLDGHLTRRDFITDHGYSVADVAVYGYTHLAPEGGFDLAPYPHVRRWIDRVQSSPRYADVGALLPT